VLHPDLAFQHRNPLLLTTEGEFVVKNLVLIAGGIAVGGTVPQDRQPRAPERGAALIRWVFGFVMTVILTVGVAAAWVFGTTSGATWLLRQAFDRYVPGHRLIIGDARGTLLSGFRVRNVEIPELDRFGSGAVRVEEAGLSGLWPHWLEGLKVLARGVELRGTRWVDTVIAGEVDGDLSGRVELRDVEASGILRFPEDSSVQVQRLVLELPFRVERIRSVENGRLRLPYAEPIIFFGTQADGRINLRTYARTLDLNGVLQALAASPWMAAVTGTLRDVDLTITGTPKALTAAGQLRVTRLTRRTVTLTQTPVQLKLTASGWPGPFSLEGDVGLFRGLLETNQTAVRIDGGTFTFTGDPARPEFNVRGSAAVGGTQISITLKGTKDRPELTLTSDPPLPQTALLIMLATGKPWRDTQQAITEGQIPLDLATDFVDYFLFGGMGGKIAKRFGISDIALRHDADERTIGVQTTFVDRLDLGVQMATPESGTSGTASDPSTGPASPVLPYKIDAEYRLTNTTSVQVEGEHSRAPGGTSTASGSSTQPAAEPEANDTVLLKLKKRF
jgi:hypothetical protein